MCNSQKLLRSQTYALCSLWNIQIFIFNTFQPQVHTIYADYSYHIFSWYCKNHTNKVSACQTGCIQWLYLLRVLHPHYTENITEVSLSLAVIVTCIRGFMWISSSYYKDCNKETHTVEQCLDMQVQLSHVNNHTITLHAVKIFLLNYQIHCPSEKISVYLTMNITYKMAEKLT
jgi:hypothetical protein